MDKAAVKTELVTFYMGRGIDVYNPNHRNGVISLLSEAFAHLFHRGLVKLEWSDSFFAAALTAEAVAEVRQQTGQ